MHCRKAACLPIPEHAACGSVIGHPHAMGSNMIFLVPGMQRRALAWLRWILVGLHAFVVAAMLALFNAAQAGPQVDANIAAGLVGLALLGLGVPWTLLILLMEPSAHNHLGRFVRGVVDFGPAAVNVLLHAFLPVILRTLLTRSKRLVC